MAKIEQDPETGRIISSELSSEEAAEMGRTRAANASAEAEAKRLARAKKMVEQQFGPWGDAPEYIRLAAEQWVHGKGGSGALYNKLSGTLTPAGAHSAAIWDGKERRGTGAQVTLNGAAAIRMVELQINFLQAKCADMLVKFARGETVDFTYQMPTPSELITLPPADPATPIL